MKRIRLGRTNLQVSRVGFGGLQISTKMEYLQAERLLNAALDSGINLFDTAQGYFESEERIGRALAARRDEFLIATKTGSGARSGFWEALEQSLRRLRTDHVDIYQFHGAGAGSEGFIFSGEHLIEAMLAAKEQGKIRFIGFSSHSLDGARTLMRTGAFDVVQYPISYVGSEASERGLVEEASDLDIGFLGMKPFGGGRLGGARRCLGYVFQFAGVVPLIGFEREAELQEVVSLEREGIVLTEADLAEMAKTKAELGGAFCRGCNYCQPCPQDIPISSVLWLEVFVKQFGDEYLTRDQCRQAMESVSRCEDCRQCVARCPFDLEIPGAMKEFVRRYEELTK